MKIEPRIKVNHNIYTELPEKMQGGGQRPNDSPPLSKKKATHSGREDCDTLDVQFMPDCTVCLKLLQLLLSRECAVKAAGP